MGISRIARIGRVARAGQGGLALGPAPTVVSAEVGSVAPDVLSVTFSADMAGNGAGFTITASGGPVTNDILLVNVNPEWRCTLLNRSIANGETITFTYVPGNMSAVVGGGLLAGFVDTPVTNNVP